MYHFLGEYNCTMDDKGRVKMPADLRKQFGEDSKVKFMLAKDIEDCLVIYPMDAWAKQEELLRKLNPFNLNHQKFINMITTGLTQVEFDSADRFLVSSSLKKYLGNGKDITLKGKFDKIQVWDTQKYDQYTQVNQANIADLAEDVAGYLDGLDKDKKI